MQDKRCLRICRGNIKRAVSWYVMASYAYYVDDDPIITDECFDKVTKMLLKAHPTLNEEEQKLLPVDLLKAGTYLGEYPAWTPGVVELSREDKAE